MKYKSLTDNQRKGFDIIIKFLNKKYPFIVGWDEYEGWENYQVNLYLSLVIDLKKFEEYFNTRISKHISTEPQPFLGYALGRLSEYEKVSKVSDDIKSLMGRYYKYLPQDFVVRYEGQWLRDDYFTPRTLQVGDYHFINHPEDV